MMQTKLQTVLLLSFFLLNFLAGLSSGKYLDRCELARELKYKQRSPNSQIAFWVCIAYKESGCNTRKISRPDRDGRRNHGLFQLNDKWCSPPPRRKLGCNQPCYKFEDDDIADDFQCAQNIFREYQRIRGDGFLAWSVYDRKCKGSKAYKYIYGCF